MCLWWAKPQKTTSGFCRHYSSACSIMDLLYLWMLRTWFSTPTSCALSHTSKESGSELDTLWRRSLQCSKENGHSTQLANPSADVPLRIASDTSVEGAGAALEQPINGLWQPLKIFSHHFTFNEARYSAFGKELLATYLVVRKFHPLIWILIWLRQTDRWSSRQQRHQRPWRGEHCRWHRILGSTVSTCFTRLMC